MLMSKIKEDVLNMIIFQNSNAHGYDEVPTELAL